MKNKFVYFPKKSHHGYFDPALNKHFSSKTEKRDWMNTHKIIEDPSMESEKHRVNRLVESINEQRRKEGKKALTANQMLGR